MTRAHHLRSRWPETCATPRKVTELQSHQRTVRLSAEIQTAQAARLRNVPPFSNRRAEQKQTSTGGGKPLVTRELSVELTEVARNRSYECLKTNHSFHRELRRNGPAQQCAKGEERSERPRMIGRLSNMRCESLASQRNWLI
jgi:hypothetical protein